MRFWLRPQCGRPRPASLRQASGRRQRRCRGWRYRPWGDAPEQERAFYPDKTGSQYCPGITLSGAVADVAALDHSTQGLIGLGQFLEDAAKVGELGEIIRRQAAGGVGGGKGVADPDGASVGGGHGQLLEPQRIGLAQHLGDHGLVGGEGGVVDLLQLAANAPLGVWICVVLRFEVIVLATERAGAADRQGCLPRRPDPFPESCFVEAMAARLNGGLKLERQPVERVVGVGAVGLLQRPRFDAILAEAGQLVEPNGAGVGRVGGQQQILRALRPGVFDDGGDQLARKALTPVIGMQVHAVELGLVALLGVGAAHVAGDADQLAADQGRKHTLFDPVDEPAVRLDRFFAGVRGEGQHVAVQRLKAQRPEGAGLVGPQPADLDPAHAAPPVAAACAISMAPIFWCTRLIALSGRTMTLKRVIFPVAFHQIISTPLMVMPSISVANSRTAEPSASQRPRYRKLSLLSTSNAASRYLAVIARPTCGECTTGDSNTASSASRSLSSAASLPSITACQRSITVPVIVSSP